MRGLVAFTKGLLVLWFAPYANRETVPEESSVFELSLNSDRTLTELELLVG